MSNIQSFVLSSICVVCDFTNLNGPIFEDYFVTALQYKYEHICGLYAYGKLHEKLSEKWALAVEYPYHMILQYILFRL